MQKFLILSLLMFCCQGCASMPWAPKMEADSSGEMDPWTRTAGTEARGEYDHEEVVDPLNLRNFFMSDKAREIERNVGVGD